MIDDRPVSPATHGGRGVTPLNVNDHVIVRFTPHGHALATKGGSGLYDVPVPGEPYRVQFWPLMHAMGEHLHMGARNVFVDNRIELDPDPVYTAPAAPKSVEEMAAEMGYTKCAHPACEGYGNNTGECVSERTIIRLHAEHTAPTKPPRELPAPEWTGPDRWQTATSNGPTVGNPPDKDAPEGYQPIGAWQPFASGDSWTDWRRPLRRVQG